MNRPNLAQTRLNARKEKGNLPGSLGRKLLQFAKKTFLTNGCCDPIFRRHGDALSGTRRRCVILRYAPNFRVRGRFLLQIVRC